MGRIVGAFAMSHILMAPDGCEAEAATVVEGMKEIGRRISALDPDVIVLLSSDHMFNLNLALQPPFVVGIADRWTPIGDMDIPRDPIAGDRETAMAIVRQAAEDGFDLTRAEEYGPDHGVMIPLIFTGQTAVPMVPVIVNINIDPMPSIDRCARLGETIRRAIETRLPQSKRVVVIGAGGLSHWLCVPRHGEVSEAFDNMVIDRLVEGRVDDLVRLGNAAIVEQGGNAGIEIVSWVMAAKAGAARGAARIFYQPMRQWFTGIGGVQFDV